MMEIVVIASSTRGFAMPQADTPPVIRPYAEPLQDQDEKHSMKRIAWAALAATALVALYAGKDDIRRFHRMRSM
jgi:hypothetical protein